MENITENWQLKVATVPPLLKDIDLQQCRHPLEDRALILSVLLVGGLIVLALYFRKFDVLLTLALIWLSMVITSLQAKTFNRLRGAEITAQQFPEIFCLIQEVSKRLNAPPTRAFVIRQSSPEAHTYGFRAPYVLVLHSALIDSLNNDELRSMIGRSLAGIAFGHTRIAIVLGGDETTLPAVLSWFAWIRDLIFGWYRRLEVISSDRAAIIASGDMRTALRTLVKLSVGTAQFSSIGEDELIEQAHKLNMGMNRLNTKLIQLQSSVPPLLLRLQAMVAWGGLPPREIKRG